MHGVKTGSGGGVAPHDANPINSQPLCDMDEKEVSAGALRLLASPSYPANTTLQLPSGWPNMQPFRSGEDGQRIVACLSVYNG
jgi:hypothetical protein